MGCGSQNRMFDSLSLGTSQDCERLRPPCLQVFVIEHSKEVFRDYAAYVKKVDEARYSSLIQRLGLRK